MQQLDNTVNTVLDGKIDKIKIPGISSLLIGDSCSLQKNVLTKTHPG